MSDDLDLEIVELGDVKEVTMGTPGEHIEENPLLDLED